MTVGSKPRASVLEMPKAPASDENTPRDRNAPYVAAVPPTCSRATSQRWTGAQAFVARALVTSSQSPGRTWHGPDNAMQSRRERNAVARAHAWERWTRVSSAILPTVMVSSSRAWPSKPSVDTAGDAVAAKLASAPIVGWSKSTVCGNSVPRRSVSTFANSVAAIESSPADMSGVSAATVVPCTSQTAVEMVSAMTATPRGCAVGAVRLGVVLVGAAGSTTSTQGPGAAVAASQSSANEAATDRSDGWSKSSVCDSSVLRRSPIDVANSVAPIESRPADMSGESAAIAVPANSDAVLISSRTRPPREQALCVWTERGSSHLATVVPLQGWPAARAARAALPTRFKRPSAVMRSYDTARPARLRANPKTAGRTLG